MTALIFELPCPDISAWRAGNTGVEGVWHFDSGLPGRHVMVSALVHGNELCGAWALCGLLAAGVRPAQGQLTLVFGNLAAFDRFDAQHHDASRFVDEDFNRQWMPERIAQADTQERRRAAELAPFVAQADWLLDLHSMLWPSEPLVLSGPTKRGRDLAFGIGVPDWHKLPKAEQDTYVERAGELLDELQPAPQRSADYMRIVFGHISPERLLLYQIANCALVLRFEPRIEVWIVVASRRCSAACNSL